MSFLAFSRVSSFLLASSLITTWISFASATEPPKVHEITMAAPDIVRVEIREAPLRLGRIKALPSPSNAAHGSWIGVGDHERGVIIGPRRDHARTADTADIQPLDRIAVDRPAGYGPIGSRRVVTVHRKSVPWSSGAIDGGVAVASFRHYIYLKLDGPLPFGDYTIEWPTKLLSPTQFTFDDRLTRSSSIRASQLGHRANDTSKYAYLSLWLPNGPDDGAVDFRRYGLDKFHVINDRGEAVFTGSIVLRVGPKDEEPGSGVGGKFLTYTRADGTKYEANRAGTYVFGLDYSPWRDASPGTYRIAIPKLGTSDPFMIDDAVWYRAARASMAGLYHQRSGLALDGRFGYVRPECFTEASGIVVRQSRMPLAFSKEGGGFVSFNEAAKAPWISDVIVRDAWGGYHDAGDWDRRIDHVAASYLLLDVYEQIPKSARNVKLGTPASREVLRHPFYQGKGLPDIVEEAIWNLDFFRRLQRTDGAVRGGIESAGTPRPWEPCWLESQTVFAYAPDPEASFAYAAGAAKLAIVLSELDELVLAELFRESALRAWGWAERAFSDPSVAFGEARRLLGLTDAEYGQRLKQVLQRVDDNRLWAAGALFRLTGEDRFNQAVQQRFATRWVDFGFVRGDGAWEYANALHSTTNLALQKTIRERIVDVARRFIVDSQTGKVAYKNMKYSGAPMMWGEGLAPSHYEVATLIRAHRITGAKQFLATMFDGSAHILGANQIGMSFTIGLGHRWPLAPLHEDSIAAGVPALAPAGLELEPGLQRRHFDCADIADTSDTATGSPEPIEVRMQGGAG